MSNTGKFKDAKNTCSHAYVKASRATKQENGKIFSTPSIWCNMKNICLDNISCGVCNQYDKIEFLKDEIVTQSEKLF